MIETILDTALNVAATIDQPSPKAPPGAERITIIASWVSWIVTFAAVIAFMVVGGTMMFQNQRGDGVSDASKRIAMILGGLIVAGAAAGLVTTFG